MVSIIGIFGPVKVEIMGAGTEFGAVITDIGRLFQTLTFSGRKREQYRVQRLLRHFEQKEEQ